MAVFDEKWQKTKASITDRGILMFNKDLLSDVSLVVRASSDEGEPKKSKMAIPAHKFVLTSCSPVFFAMFCGELAERSDSVDLPDCEYEGVLEMLRYMYSGKAELNEGNVMQVLYVAKKYLVNSLADECVRLLRKEILNPANVFCVLPHAQQYDEKILVDQCWEVIDRETEEAVKSEGFATIKRSLLEAVVKRDSLTIREVELFKSVDFWASKECERQGLMADGKVKRQILGEVIVKEIRFPVMEEKEFADAVPHSEILTPQELVNTMQQFNSELASPVGFKENERVGTLQSCFRFGRVGLNCFDLVHEDCIHFHMNKDIVLHGISLFGSENNEYMVSLTVNEVHGREIAKKSGKFSSVLMHRIDICFYGFVVLFDPVHLTRDDQYCVQVKMNGPRTCSGRLGIKEVTSHGVTFFFTSCSNIGRKSNVLFGQFGDFLFKLP
ncbi:BTB/POZ domain-containing protein 6-B-like [Oculina patagonica]